MRLVIETTETGWQQKLTINGTTYAMQIRVQEDGTLQSEEGLTFGAMLESRGVDKETAGAVCRAVDLTAGTETGYGMYRMVREGKAG